MKRHRHTIVPTPSRPALEPLPLDPQVVKKERQYRMAALIKKEKP